jgi:hypothetical protein
METLTSGYNVKSELIKYRTLPQASQANSNQYNLLYTRTSLWRVMPRRHTSYLVYDSHRILLLIAARRV